MEVLRAHMDKETSKRPRPKSLEDDHIIHLLLQTAADATGDAREVVTPTHCRRVLDQLLRRQAECCASLDVERYPILGTKLIAVANAPPTRTAAQVLRIV